jgi:hypothetical protein
MEQSWAHWWNGKWERIARRDLCVNQDGTSAVRLPSKRGAKNVGPPAPAPIHQ